jgi:hypothetical protein
VRLEQADDLDQPVDPDLGLVEADAHGFELAAQHPGADPDLQSALGEQVERCRLGGEHGGDVEVDCENPAADAQVLGRFSSGGDGGDGRQVLGQMGAAVVYGSRS